MSVEPEDRINERVKKVADLMAQLLQEDGVPMLALLQSLFLTFCAQSKMPIGKAVDAVMKSIFVEGSWPEPLREHTLVQEKEDDPDTWFIRPVDEATQN